jgi:hypothetical protein
MKEFYFGFSINSETKSIDIIAVDPNRDKCEKKCKFELNDCEDYIIFNFYVNFKEDFLWWLNENGITRLEAEKLFQDLGKHVKKIIS